MKPVAIPLPSVVRNKKLKTLYIASKEVINCTNSQDGQGMVEYRPVCGHKTFVREIGEFNEKFEFVCYWRVRPIHLLFVVGIAMVVIYTAMVFGVTYVFSRP